MSDASEPREFRVTAHGIEQVAFEWNADARGRGASFVMAHATGFHARCWDQVIRKLGHRHVVAVDLRGHGRTTHVPIENWRDIGEDLAALVGVLELENIIGVGHSMGGHAMVDAAALHPEPFRGLILFDPVIGDPSSYGEGMHGHFAEYAEGGHPIAKRRNAFESAEAMRSRFADRAPYCFFEPETLRDYCEYGLLTDAEQGGFVLACPPAIEASVYMTSRSNARIFESVRQIEAPVLILRAKTPEPGGAAFDFSFSPTWPQLVGEFPNARDVHFPEATHFMPLEDSAAMARLILEQEALVSEAS